MDFFKNKIVLRSALSSIAPIMLYSFGYGMYKLFMKSSDVVTADIEYTNMYAWLTILAFAIVYPLN